jgi:hypothetical protein
MCTNGTADAIADSVLRPAGRKLWMSDRGRQHEQVGRPLDPPSKPSCTRSRSKARHHAPLARDTDPVLDPRIPHADIPTQGRELARPICVGCTSYLTVC